MRVKLITGFGALAITTILAIPAHGQVRTWVSPHGLDSNPCTLQQPCRNFAAAITAVAPGGEVVALDSGGFGAVTVTKSVTLISPQAVHAAIAPTVGSAITLAAADGDHVGIRNLYLNSQGADNGIHVTNVGELWVEESVISGFGARGVSFSPTSDRGRLHLSRTTIRDCLEHGVYGFRMDLVMYMVLNGVQIHNCGTGLFVEAGHAVIRDTVASGGTTGFHGGINSTLVIEDSVAANNGYGFLADSGNVLMTLHRCASNSNTIAGIHAAGVITQVHVSETTITGNALGLSIASEAVILTRGNNAVRVNGTNGSFSGPSVPR